MRERRYGRIVQYRLDQRPGRPIWSGQLRPRPNPAFHGFTKALAQEGAAMGITVNAIAPGYIETSMVGQGSGTIILEKIVAGIPVGRLGQAEEMPVAWCSCRQGGWFHHRLDLVRSMGGSICIRGKGKGKGRGRGGREGERGERVGMILLHCTNCCGRICAVHKFVPFDLH